MGYRKNADNEEGVVQFQGGHHPPSQNRLSTILQLITQFRFEVRVELVEKLSGSLYEQSKKSIYSNMVTMF